MRFLISLALTSALTSSLLALDPESKRSPSSAPRAILDAEASKAYALRVVLFLGDHGDFTPYFRTELKRELRGSLQAALGPLAHVEVIEATSLPKDEWEPQWKQVREKGLEALDSFNELGGGKTHYMMIDCNEGRYDLQARQHDGSTGFVTPLVRRASTPTRSFVSRLAGLMIGRDFGLVGTVDPSGVGGKVFIKIKAGELGPIDRWVKMGDVFAVVQIRQERRRAAAPKNNKGPARPITSLTGHRLDGVLLRVIGEQRDGVIPCQMFHRFEGPFESRGGVGYRCVKLGATEGSLKLQLVDANGQPYKGTAIQVYARADDYPDGLKEAERTTSEHGYYESKEKFANVALVRVLLGNRRLAQLPIEILDDRVAVRTIRLDPTAELRDHLETERRALMTRITDGRLIQVRCFQEITALEQADKKQLALERGQAASTFLDGFSGEAQEEIDKIQTRAKDLPNGNTFARDCEQQLQILRVKQEELNKHLDDLRVAILEEKDPQVQEKKKKVQDLVRNAELLVTQAEYDQALAKYQEALAEVQNEPAAKERIEAIYQKLKNAWALRDGDADHAAARKFVYEVWSKLGTPQEVKEHLGTARLAFEKCKEVGDRLTLNKMNLSSVEITTRFGDELKKMIDATTDDDERKMLEMYEKVNDDMQKLFKDIQAYLLVKKEAP